MGDGGDIREVSFVRRTSDATINNDNTPNNDSQLILPIAANEMVRVKIQYYWNATVNGGIIISINGPAAPTNLKWGGVLWGEGGANVDMTNNSNYNSQSLQLLLTSGIGWIEGLIENGANAGNIYASWSQHTSHVDNTTVERGSFMQMWRVA